LEDIFGLHGGPEYLRIDYAREIFREFVPPNLLAFASDPYGNHFAIALEVGNCKSIYFVGHERLPV
jgi:hypothetical protein